MSWDSLLAFNAILIAALASPGPAFILALRTAVSEGRMAGIATGAGLGLMAATWTLAALLGLESLFAIAPWSYGALKLGGALYLIWIAVQTWRHADAPLDDVAAPRHGRAFVQGLLVNLGNPKSVLFAGAVIVVVFPKGLDATGIALVVANHLALELIFYSFAALALSTGPARRGYLRLKPLLDRIAATLLGALGLRLIVEK
ncbi:MAG: LysE family transporter [Marinibacterium sp.]|nr:LysE family transporter [Marinibacterium sp.]